MNLEGLSEWQLKGLIQRAQLLIAEIRNPQWMETQEFTDIVDAYQEIWSEHQMSFDLKIKMPVSFFGEDIYESAPSDTVIVNETTEENLSDYCFEAIMNHSEMKKKIRELTRKKKALNKKMVKFCQAHEIEFRDLSRILWDEYHE